MLSAYPYRMVRNFLTCPFIPVRIEAGQCKVGSAKIYYETAGRGKPLILVHGLAGSSLWWRHNIAALAHHFRIYSIDLIGFGQSQSAERFSLAQAATYLAQWMESLELTKADVIGFSMGGRIASELAADFPHKVARLVLVDAPVVSFNGSYLKQAWGMLQELRRVPMTLLPTLLADTFQSGIFTTLSLGHTLFHSDLVHKLPQIQAPTLVIWGEQDTLVPVDLGKRLSQNLPASQLATIPGAGHIPMWQKPKEFNRLVVDFLGRPAKGAVRKQKRRVADISTRLATPNVESTHSN